jgi:hypothetical protein
MRAVAARLLQRGLDEASLEVGHGAVIAERFVARWRIGKSVHGPMDDATGMPRRTCAKTRARATCTPPSLPSVLGGVHKNEGPSRWRGPDDARRFGVRQDFVAGFTPGWSLKNCLLSSMKFFH